MDYNVLIDLVFIALALAIVIGVVVSAVCWVIEKVRTHKEIKIRYANKKTDVIGHFDAEPNNGVYTVTLNEEGKKILDDCQSKIPEAKTKIPMPALKVSETNTGEDWVATATKGELNTIDLADYEDNTIFRFDLDWGCLTKSPEEKKDCCELKPLTEKQLETIRTGKVAYYATIEDDRYASGKPCITVTFPDLDDCCTWGDTLSEALQNARGVLKDYLVHSEPEFIKEPSSASELVKQGHTGWIARVEVKVFK